MDSRTRTKRDLSFLFGVSTEKRLYCAFVGFMLVQNRHRLATDLRDKVFAPMALAKMITREKHLVDSFPLPDYTKKVEDIYCQMTTCIISQLGNLEFLSFVERHGEAPLSLPSWTPDFSTPSCSKPLSEISHNATKLWKSSTSRSPPKINFQLLLLHAN